MNTGGHAKAETTALFGVSHREEGLAARLVITLTDLGSRRA